MKFIGAVISPTTGFKTSENVRTTNWNNSVISYWKLPYSCSVALVVSDSATLWTVAPQAPMSMGFPRQEYWSELPFPSPGDLSNPGIEPKSPALQADSLSAEPQGKPKNIGVRSYPFSSGSSRLGNRTGLSCIAGEFFTN